MGVDEYLIEKKYISDLFTGTANSPENRTYLKRGQTERIDWYRADPAIVLLNAKEGDYVTIERVFPWRELRRIAWIDYAARYLYLVPAPWYMRVLFNYGFLKLKP